MHIGLEINNLARKKKINLAELARRIGRDKQSVYEMVKKEDLNTGLLKKIAMALDVPITHFFEDFPLSTELDACDMNEEVYLNSLAEFRRVNKIRQDELAKFLHVSPAFLSQIENGKRKMPSSYLIMLMNNDRGWDASMLVDEKMSRSTSGNYGIIMGSHNANNTIDNRHHYDSLEILKSQVDLLNARIQEKDAQLQAKDAQIQEKDAQIRQLLEILKTK